LDLFFFIWVNDSLSYHVNSCSVGLFPLWEGRFAIASTVRAIYKDLSGKGRTPVMTGESIETSTPPGEDVKGTDNIGEATEKITED